MLKVCSSAVGCKGRLWLRLVTSLRTQWTTATPFNQVLLTVSLLVLVVVIMLLFVLVLSCWTSGVHGDLQDFINNRMYSCVRDVEYCRRHSPNHRINIWNWVFDKLYIPFEDIPKMPKTATQTGAKVGGCTKEDSKSKSDPKSNEEVN